MAPIKGAKLKQIPVDVKLQIVRRANSGESLHSLSKETLFSHWQIHQWVANADELKTLVNKWSKTAKWSKTDGVLFTVAKMQYSKYNMPRHVNWISNCWEKSLFSA